MKDFIINLVDKKVILCYNINMINRGLFSSNSTEWATPQKLFDELNKEFHFTLDPCASAKNHKCERYYTKKSDGLSRSWVGKTVFCNPPYGREISKWIEKCYTEYRKNQITVVMLLPARTDTKWFHDYVYRYAEIRFLRGRLHFNDGLMPAPFPSMIVVYTHLNLRYSDIDD